MRTRQEIESDRHEIHIERSTIGRQLKHFADLILEVVLDCRDLLLKANEAPNLTQPPIGDT